MFADFLRRLTAPAPTPLNDADARLALGALLVRIAKSDGDYAVAEIAHIDTVLAERYALDAIGAAKLRADCEQLELEAPDTVRFTKAIKGAVPYEDRAAVIRALWQVVLADGIREDEENALMRMVAPMLGIADAESHRIRLDVDPAR